MPSTFKVCLAIPLQVPWPSPKDGSARPTDGACRSSRRIVARDFPLLLVSHATEIEVAPITSPVEVGGQGISFLGNLGKARIQAVVWKCFQELQERCFLLEQQPVRIERRLTRDVVPSFNQAEYFPDRFWP